MMPVGHWQQQTDEISLTLPHLLNAWNLSICAVKDSPKQLERFNVVVSFQGPCSMQQYSKYAARINLQPYKSCYKLFSAESTRLLVMYICSRMSQMAVNTAKARRQSTVEGQ